MIVVAEGELLTVRPKSPSLIVHANTTVKLPIRILRESTLAGSRVNIKLLIPSHLVDMWEDLAKLHRVLTLLERDTMLPALLGSQDDPTTVRIGTETGTGEDDLAVVATSFGAGGSVGRIGVLGPMRMDYRRTIRVVEEISEALGESLDS